MADGNVAAEQLRLFLERIERLTEEKKGIADDIRDVFAEAKGSGFDSKTMREILKLRAMDPESRREREALLDTYKAALGMLDGTPLGKWAIERLQKSAEEPEPSPDEAKLAEELYVNAVRLVVQHKKASTSWLQRTLRIGYNPAAALIERMERAGIVSSPDARGSRKVLTDEAPDPGSAPAPVAKPTLAPQELPPEPTVDDARRLGREAAHDNRPVTSNPFPAFDERRAAWDEEWCAALGSDGMDIPAALKPAPKAKKSEPAGEPA